MLKAWTEAALRSTLEMTTRMANPPKAISGQAWQRSSVALRGASRYGAARPAFATRQMFQGQARRGFRFSAWRGSSGAGQAKQQSLSMGQRLRKLSSEYGKAAVGVYFLLSILDYPFFFLLVRTVGAERIGKIEHVVVSTITSVVPEPVRVKVREYWDALRDVFRKDTGQSDDKAEADGWGVEEARERNREEASLATQLALAYAVHKSFIFVRIPLTAAVTPRVVKTLRSWGWNIGKPLRKSS